MLDKALLEWINCHIIKYKKLPLFDKLRIILFNKKYKSTNNSYIFYIFYIYKHHLYITKLIKEKKNGV